MLLMTLVSCYSGCVSSKYQFHPKPSRPNLLHLRSVAAVPENDSVASEAPLVEIVLHSVIVLDAPGSWKKRAYWDEYVLSLNNRSESVVTVEAVTLTDFQHQLVTPGTDPWRLEKTSRDYEARLASTLGDVVKIGAGVFVASGTGIAAGAAAVALSNVGGFTAMGVVGGAMFAAIPVYAVGTVYRNVSGKKNIEREFNVRSLKLPIMLAPRGIIEGSLFFRVSPGPKRLTLHLREANDTRRELAIDLAPLANLHFKPGSAPR